MTNFLIIIIEHAKQHQKIYQTYTQLDHRKKK